MYNQGSFATIRDAASAAQKEEWRGWLASPAHRALYESKISSADVVEAITSVNISEGAAKRLAATVAKPGYVQIFQLHTTAQKHGAATGIRYNYETHVGGFSQERFDEWWGALDKNDNDWMENDEMKAMMQQMDINHMDRSVKSYV